ncbi:Methyl-cpg-binding domain-containing protein [Thalictrum thalictroides]|uniref:Methyl-cpg-binding domain-containing protein n=1 Tax=Thalictrum thalictroides TaxID=46969 RepID=A0A7J6W196_THATH|nr:Methyl-cpg-binding domain-containing protein [Thalictrum thalictroides]
MQSICGDLSHKVKEEESQPRDASLEMKMEKGESAESCPTNLLDNTLEKPLDANLSGEKEDDTVQTINNEEDQMYDSAQNQLVVYNPEANGMVQVDSASEPAEYMSPSPIVPRLLPSVGAFTVQCANCFKWRLIPTKEKYEEIRETILEQPFICERAQEWRPDISCDDPADISQDGSRLWAIDKPNIAQPPPGWERLLRIRGEGGTRFADVYYTAPSGKRLRSMVEIQKYLDEHPESVEAGITTKQFSFQIPKPLQEDYVRKRPRVDLSIARPLDTTEANPLSWAGPIDGPDLQLGQPGMSSQYVEDPNSHRTPPSGKQKAAKSSSKKTTAQCAEDPSSPISSVKKKKNTKSPSKHKHDNNDTYSQPIKVEEPQPQSYSDL